tara:strand:- start:131 stop:577 length:447 start_codon:yes stop_codon:yes gene_type:complete
MARAQNVKNLTTEKIGITILKNKLKNFIVPNKEEKEYIFNTLGIDTKKYSRSIDGVQLIVPTAFDVKGAEDCLLIEIKTTNAKNVKELPYNVFFGITKNEEDLFKEHCNYRLCIVHTGKNEFKLLTFKEYEGLIQNKRIQYQINFKSK